MSKYNLLLFAIVIAVIAWNMFSGNLLLAIIDVGFLCAFLLSLILILIELVALNKKMKRRYFTSNQSNRHGQELQDMAEVSEYTIRQRYQSTKSS